MAESVVKSNDAKEDKDIIGVESVNLINKYLFSRCDAMTIASFPRAK